MAAPWRVVGFGLLLQFALGVFVIRTDAGAAALRWANAGVLALLDCALEGAALLFGNLARDVTVPVVGPDGEPVGRALTISLFAFQVLPTIVFFSSLAAVLYHAGVMGRLVGAVAWVMRRTMGTSGAETLNAAANVFFGQTESPLFVRPFLPGMTRSELHAVMVAGFSNIASGVLGVYAGLLAGAGVAGAGGHLLAASLVSAPAGLVVAKLLLPETGGSETGGGVSIVTPRTDANLIDAAARGALDGLKLALNVGAMLIAFVGLVALVNLLLGNVSLGGEPLTLQRVLGWLFVPAAWLCGVPASESATLGTLIGLKTVLNEFLAYEQLAAGLTADGAAYLAPRSTIIAVYALCGFANFASVAIQIGGIGAMAPDRRRELSELGLLAMLGGTVASLMTACVVGMLLPA